MNEMFFGDLTRIKKDKLQWEAFESYQNTVIIAGPGSGKTRVLALKAVSLAKSYIHKPSGLACISYSRETVRELKRRLLSYGYSPGNRDFIGTVHSFSLLHVIQPFVHLYPQYNITFPISILPDEISRSIYLTVIKELKINEKEITLTEINKHRSLALAGRSNIQINSGKQIIRAAEMYEKKLKQTEYIDFINIINISSKIIHEQAYVRKALHCQFPWLLVDEYQDLGRALHEMVLDLFFYAGIKLYAVGDVNQSIYGFNGGFPQFLKELTTYDNIKTIELTSNYRSSQHIIDASIEALQPNPPYPKYVAEKRKDDLADFTFITCEEEMDEQYEIVANKIIPKLLNKKVPLNEIGIITSSNAQTHQMAFFLQKKNIPFYIVNWRFENSAVAVWLQDCALWCSNRYKQSFDELFRFWKRLINSHNDSRKEWENIRLKTELYKILIESNNSQDCYNWLTYVVSGLKLNEVLANSEIYPNEVENIGNLVKEAELYNLKHASIERLANLGFPENEVTITTRHSSKGLEFEVVILLGMEQDHFPSFYHTGNPTALAEDQRLCYVCISRAKKTCMLLRSKFFTIQTRRGPWRKEHGASPYWNSLYSRFGNNQNSFTSKSYN